jgi:hypothetical protein
MDPDLDVDPAISVIVLQDANKKLNVKKSFSAITFSEIKVKKKSQSSRKQDFLTTFAW